jgi:D-lactate dehydrogenase (cytochrome)
VIRALAPPPTAAPDIRTDPDILEAYLEDASGAPAGTAAGLVRVVDEAEAAAVLRDERHSAFLFQAARSSLTGGAIPRGETILSVERMDAIGPVERDAGGARVTVQPGVRLQALQSHLAQRGLYYPPVPTYQEAMVGGTVATNAGGAASFKYGVTRDWVSGLRVLLANGDVLVLERGEAMAGRGDAFELRLTDGTLARVPTPNHRLPDLKKISAGYHTGEPLDLVDLFIGSEGTLGLIVGVTLELVPLPAGVVTGLAFLGRPDRALELATALRSAAGEARRRPDPAGPDVRAIEWFDEHCLRMLVASGDDRRLRIDVPAGSRAALLFEVELPEPMTDRQAHRQLEQFVEHTAAAEDGPLLRLFRLLADYDGLETLQFAFPEESDRGRALNQFREATPTRFGELLASRRRREPQVNKVGGDLIVPYRHVQEMLALYARGFERRGLEFAIWGHLSDGNLHPNALPRDARETHLGHEALLEFGDEAVRRGGAPLSEHGVGRNPIKQEMLRRFVGDAAIRRMRDIKLALDPGYRLAPGVLFPAS